MHGLASSLLGVGTFSSLAQAIYVTPRSPCADSCGNVLTSTSPDDIVCLDGDYGSDAGSLFETCIKCLMSSTYTSNGHTDIQASLYNMRYTLSSCLWGVPTKKDLLGDSPCITSKACLPFEAGMTFQNLSTNATDFSYCNSWQTADTIDLKGCTDCLQVSGDEFYLANFVTMLEAGCKQKPDSGVLLSTEGNVFSADHVNVTTPSAQPTIDPAWFDHGPLNLGAKVGIAVGGFVLLLILLGAFIIWNGKRRRRAYLRKLEAKYAGKGWPTAQGNMEVSGTPLSQRPLRGWDDSPITETDTKPFPRYISPYSSQFNSPADTQDMGNMPWPAAALPKDHHIGVALGDTKSPTGAGSWENSARSQEGSDKGKRVVESYEMHDVDTSEHGGSRDHHTNPPTMQQPGYERYVDYPQGHSTLSEHDVRNGNAI